MNSGMEEKKYDCVRGFIAVKTRNGHSALYKAFPMRCKSWDCPYCAKIKGDQYKQRMKPLFDRGSLYFYTFTFYHNLPALESWSSVSSTWNRFRTAAAKKYGRFSYVRVLEHHHRSNYPHLHVIADVRFNDVWLAKELKTAGFGYHVALSRSTASVQQSTSVSTSQNPGIQQYVELCGKILSCGLSALAGMLVLVGAVIKSGVCSPWLLTVQTLLTRLIEIGTGLTVATQ